MMENLKKRSRDEEEPENDGTSKKAKTHDMDNNKKIPALQLVKNQDTKLFNKYKIHKFDLSFYCKNCISQDLVFIFGYSLEGKSVLASLLLLNKFIYNINNNIKTRLIVFAGSDSAGSMISKLIEYICDKRPIIKQKWNTKDCLIWVDFKTEFSCVVEEFKAVCAPSLKTVDKIFYFDDVGTDLSNSDGDHKKLFDDLGSKARHFNITTIINSQKIVGISHVLTKQIKTFFVVGKITQTDFKEMNSRLSCFYDFEEGSAKDFGLNWFSTIGCKMSRNVLVMSTPYVQLKHTEMCVLPLKLDSCFYNTFFDTETSAHLSNSHEVRETAKLQ